MIITVGVVVVIIVVAFCALIIYGAVSNIRKPNVEQWKVLNEKIKYKWENKTDEQIIKDIKRNNTLTAFFSTAIIVFTIFIYVILVVEFRDSPSVSYEQSPRQKIDEKQMNDLGYYKENGKWNYEGGDAGQNDGVAGD